MDNNYKVISKLGSGSFGDVFLVKNSANLLFALKRVSLNKPENYKYVIREFKIMRNLKHPRIIRMVDFYASSSAYNIVMEYAKNGTLRDLISVYSSAKRRFSSRDLIRFFMDVAHGVRYLHQNNIIHRDLKPDNILVDRNFSLKLGDFGVSKILQNSFTPVNQTVIGTLSYMSPEVFLNRPYDSSSDIWALGLILYEMAFFRYMFTPYDKDIIMDYRISYKCIVGNWRRYSYDNRYQSILEMMVQRNPRFRASADEVINSHLIKYLIAKASDDTQEADPNDTLLTEDSS